MSKGVAFVDRRSQKERERERERKLAVSVVNDVDCNHSAEGSASSCPLVAPSARCGLEILSDKCLRMRPIKTYRRSRRILIGLKQMQCSSHAHPTRADNQLLFCHFLSRRSLLFGAVGDFQDMTGGGTG